MLGRLLLRGLFLRILMKRTVTFKGAPIAISGNVLKVGDQAPDFKLVDPAMQEVKFSDYAGKTLILSVVPSLDTPVCSTQTKKFNSLAAGLSDAVKILTVSLDLPFAQKRWCGAEGVTAVKVASDYKFRTFGEAYGAFLPDLGLLARAIFVIDQNKVIRHVEYVAEVASEPNYDQALQAVKTCAQ